MRLVYWTRYTYDKNTFVRTENKLGEFANCIADRVKIYECKDCLAFVIKGCCICQFEAFGVGGV